MSLRVLFVILSLFVIGFHAGWEMTSAFLAGKLLIQPAVLFVPIGIGLSLGFPFARSSADALFKLIYLFSLLACLFVLADSRLPFPKPILGLNGAWVFVVVILIYTAFLGFLHWLLFTQPFDEWLTRDTRAPADRPDRGTPARTRG